MPQELRFDGSPSQIELVQLNGQVMTRLTTTRGKDGRVGIKFGIPRFGIRTLKFAGESPKPSS